MSAKRASYDSGPPWYSSYEKNNYGEVFYSLVRVYQPKIIVELGTKAGFSAYHLARGLKDNGKGRLYCHDLWEEYPYRSVSQQECAHNLKPVAKFVTLKPGNAIGADKQYRKVDILHVDLSNHGEILEQVVPDWIEKVRQLIIIEGGSYEHDQIEWMIKYQKKPMREWLAKLLKKRKDLEMITLAPFPSLTIIRSR